MVRQENSHRRTPRQVAVPVAQLVENSLVVVVTAKLPHPLCVYDRRQRLGLLERDDRGDSAGLNVVQQIPRPSARVLLDVLVAQDEVGRSS